LALGPIALIDSVAQDGTTFKTLIDYSV